MTDLVEPVGADDHVRGPEGADLELVMYGDFECPYCAGAQRILARVEQRLEGRLSLVFRHFPLPEVHPHAEHAAQIAEAAAAQGAFWEMHDALYANRGRLTDPDLIARGGELGLDVERLRAELEAGAWAARVERDRASGLASGVTGTPGFFANGTRVDSAFDAGSLVAALLA